MKRTFSIAASAFLVAGATLGVAATNADAATACSTNAQWGQCSFPPYVLQNNVWNAAAAPGWTQTLSATSASDWSVSSDMPGTGTTVISYPNASDQLASPEALSTWSDINGSYNTTLPSGTFSGEAAYDIWLNHIAGGSNAQEVMIWTDNHGQTPAGSSTGNTWTDPTTGDVYTIWDQGPADDYGTVTLLADTNSASGKVDILDALTYLISNDYVLSGPLASADYGFEIASTDGIAQTFTVNDYGLTFTGCVTTGNSEAASTAPADLVANPNGAREYISWNMPCDVTGAAWSTSIYKDGTLLDTKVVTTNSVYYGALVDGDNYTVKVRWNDPDSPTSSVSFTAS